MTDFTTAECGIRQLQARYIDAVWRKDLDAFGDCFVEDAEWHVADFESDDIAGTTEPKVITVVVKGRKNAVQFFGQFFEHFDRILMTLRTPILQVNADGTAIGRTYCTEQNARKDKLPFMSAAIYYDRFVQQGDRWRFKWRYFQIQYMGPPDLSGRFFDMPDPGPFPGMPDGSASKPARMR